MAYDKKQAGDAGLALVFIALLTAIIGGYDWAVLAAAALTLLLMISPAPFAPWARLWFGLSHAIGTVVSKVLLSLVFYGLVTPVGLLRRAMGKDPMRADQWKAGDASVFRVRDEQVAPEDLERMF